jgi:hypothetical protein
MTAESGARLLSDDGDDRLMVELRVVEAVQQMDGSGSRGRHADANFVGELRVRTGHEGGQLLVSDLDETRIIARFSAPISPLMPSPG